MSLENKVIRVLIFISYLLFLNGCIGLSQEQTSASPISIPDPAQTAQIHPPTPSFVIYTPAVTGTSYQLTVSQSPTSEAAVYSTPTSAPTATFIDAPLPDGLQVVFIAEDILYLWKPDEVRKLLSLPLIYHPKLSGDGNWIAFIQEVDGDITRYDLWVVRTDGSELHRLLSAEDISILDRDDSRLILDEFAWMSGEPTLLFNTLREMEGPPGAWPSFDLFQVDILGNISRLAKPDQGGKFIPSPDGHFIAVASPSRIGVINLKSGLNRSLLNFDHLMMPCSCYNIPQLRWTENSQAIIVSIPPSTIYYPAMYEGEPEQIWQLEINEPPEILAQVEPSLHRSVVNLSPGANYYFYFEGGTCIDGSMGMIHLRSLDPNGINREMFCAFSTPDWTPDGEHFHFKLDGKWHYGSVSDSSTQEMEFLDQPTNPSVSPSINIEWIDGTYYLMYIHTPGGCSISIGTVEGIVSNIYRTSLNSCPRTSFSLSK